MKNVNVRLEDDLHARIKKAAEAERRSLNSEIAWLLTLGLQLHDAGRYGSAGEEPR